VVVVAHLADDHHHTLNHSRLSSFKSFDPTTFWKQFNFSNCFLC